MAFMMIDFEPGLLRTFVAVIETGSLTGAGRRVGRTQPAVTHQLNRLEQAIKRPLFGPDRRNLVLTADGEMLLQYARAMLRLHEEARDHFSSPPLEGRVILGTPDLYAAYLLPDILSRFSRSYPGVELELRCRRSVYLEAALREGELDLALVTRQPEGMEGQLVRREPLVWVTGFGSQPEAEEIVPLALLPEGSVYRERALEALDSAQRRWRIVSVCDSIAGMLAAVLAGLAVAVFPRCALQPTVRRLGQRDGFPPLPQLDLLLLRRQPQISSAAKQFSDYIAREL
jgi:DNA-binding transcriptional LysR family regulator